MVTSSGPVGAESAPAGPNHPKNKCTSGITVSITALQAGGAGSIPVWCLSGADKEHGFENRRGTGVHAESIFKNFAEIFEIYDKKVLVFEFFLSYFSVSAQQKCLTLMFLFSKDRSQYVIVPD